KPTTHPKLVERDRRRSSLRISWHSSPHDDTNKPCQKTHCQPDEHQRINHCKYKHHEAAACDTDKHAQHMPIEAECNPLLIIEQSGLAMLLQNMSRPASGQYSKGGVKNDMNDECQ